MRFILPFIIGLVSLSLGSLRAAGPIPVIHSTDLYHPYDDPDDHFDLAVMYALPGIELKHIILDQGAKQAQKPGSIPVRQLNAITGRNVPFSVGLGRNLANPTDRVLDDRPALQVGVEAILKVLRESPTPVSMVSLGSCRDIAAAFNREPDLVRKKLDKLMIFIGDADAKRTDYREYNVELDRNAYICILRSGLNIYWVPCFEGGVFKNAGRASLWVGPHSDLLRSASPPMLQYFIYALEKKNPLTDDPVRFVSLPPDPAEMQRLLAGRRNLWCASVFVALTGNEIIRQGDGWAAVPSGSVKDARPVFTFRPVDVAIGDDAAITYEQSARSRRVMQFHVEDMQNYPAAMTAVTAKLLSSMVR